MHSTLSPIWLPSRNPQSSQPWQGGSSEVALGSEDSARPVLGHPSWDPGQEPGCTKLGEVHVQSSCTEICAWSGDGLWERNAPVLRFHSGLAFPPSPPSSCPSQAQKTEVPVPPAGSSHLSGLSLNVTSGSERASDQSVVAPSSVSS